MADGGTLTYRDAADSDLPGLMDLIRSVFAEYPGCVFDLSEMPELLRPASHFSEQSGGLWVAESGQRIVGSLGLSRAGDGIELHKVYVHRDARRSGIARRLLSLALDRARGTGAKHIELWTDTRFESGHRFYEACGFVRLPETRELHDLSGSVEYHYRLELTAPRLVQLDSAELRRLSPELNELLRDAVDSGASVGFLPPLSMEEAADYWRSAGDAIEEGSRVLLAAFLGDWLAGSVQLDLATKANALHRAEAIKLMVHREARRRGVGRALMNELERIASERGRSLLVLDTRKGDVSEALYERLGYRRAGAIPGYARSASGELHDTVLFYKQL